MRRKAAAIALATCTLLGTVAGTAEAAYPTSDFNGRIDAPDGGILDGTFTWLARAVGVSGQVVDLEDAGSTTVQFEFFAGDRLQDIQTRTATNKKTPFGWTEPGPVGGITSVQIYLFHNGHKEYVATVPRRK